MAKGGRKGQGLPINLIVIVAIAVLVLVLVIAFATGSLSKLFGGAKLLSETATPDQAAAFKIGCEQACFSAQQLSNTENSWGNSSYCGRIISTTESGNNTHCWEAPVVSECSKSITLADGSKKTCAGAGKACICA